MTGMDPVLDPFQKRKEWENNTLQTNEFIAFEQEAFKFVICVNIYVTQKRFIV